MMDFAVFMASMPLSQRWVESNEVAFWVLQDVFNGIIATKKIKKGSCSPGQEPKFLAV
jgi:hypothetical protein